MRRLLMRPSVAAVVLGKNIKVLTGTPAAAEADGAPTPIGDSPYQTDFDDYRDTGSGVKFPFLLQMNPATPPTELAPAATLRITKVQDNAPIDEAKFVKPATRSTP